jgi:hypothetical protein
VLAASKAKCVAFSGSKACSAIWPIILLHPAYDDEELCFVEEKRCGVCTGA